jgi:formyltetrahydrofolate deformylase
MTRAFVLLFQCRDRKGIVAQVSEFILRQGGNIVNASQHSTGLQEGDFFLRVEFILEQAATAEALSVNFSELARGLNAEFTFYEKGKRRRMGILVSRPGHCLAELLYLWKTGEIAADIPFIAGNFSGHEELAGQYGVPFHFIPARKDGRKEAEILALAAQTDFLVLARYMLVLSAEFLRAYGKDIINIHHGLLPAFQGADPYAQAFACGVKVIGATAHFADEKLDGGPIIAQVVGQVSHEDDAASLARKGRRLERHALAQAVEKYLDYRVIRQAQKTVVF